MTSDLKPQGSSGAPSLAPHPDPAGKRLATGIAAGAGLVCFALYLWLEGLLPRGQQEFAYFPYVTDPLPFAPMRGFTFEQLARHLGRTFVLGASLACLAFAFARVRRLASPGPRARRLMLIAVAGFSLVSTAYVMAGVLAGRAIVDDELAYRQQAELLARGKLAEDTVPPWGWEVFTIYTRLGATGKYLFGEPLVQMPGTLLGLPALLHLLLAALALWGWHRFVRIETGPGVALWATVLLAASPMFVLTNALALSHTTTITCLVLAGLGYQWATRERPTAGALLTGTALGFGLTVRPQVIVPMGAVIGLAALYGLYRRRRFAAAGALIASGSLWLALILAYNRALSGSPFKMPWYLFLPIERFGFGDVGGIEFVHTPWTAVENLLVSAVRWNGWWLGWPLSFLPLVAWLALGRPRKGAGLWLWAGAGLILINVPYYSPGISDTGPIYYFELLLPAALLGAHAIVRGFERWPAAVAAVLIVHFGLGTTTFLGENVARLRRLVTTIHAPVEEVLEQLEPPALLVHENNWRESVRWGWVWSFPVRVRDDGAPVVTFPRGEARFLQPLIERYGYRQCWYYRYNPETQARELFRCRDALALMTRKREPGPAIRSPPTAELLGLLSPDEPLSMRRWYERHRPATPESTAPD